MKQEALTRFTPLKTTRTRRDGLPFGGDGYELALDQTKALFWQICLEIS